MSNVADKLSDLSLCYGTRSLILRLRSRVSHSHHKFTLRLAWSVRLSGRLRDIDSHKHTKNRKQRTNSGPFQVKLATGDDYEDEDENRCQLRLRE